MMEKQIEKILKDKIELSLAGNYKSVYIDGFENAAKEIATLYEGWYPGEFVMWLITHSSGDEFYCKYDEKNNIVWVDTEPTAFQEDYSLANMFNHWQDNVEGK